MARGAGGKGVNSARASGASRGGGGSTERPLARMFLHPEAFRDGGAVLDGQAFHHAVRVLRMAAGDTLLLLDGSGRGWTARLERVMRSEATATLLHEVPEDASPGREVHLAIPLLKGDRTELVLQKCTELGVSEFHIYPAERSVVRMDGGGGKRERFVAVCRSAAEQCGAFRMPEVRLWDSARAFLEQVRTPGRLIAWEEESALSARDALGGGEPCTLATGPEGGLTREEVDVWAGYGFRPVSLGRRILRAETAPIALCALALCAL